MGNNEAFWLIVSFAIMVVAVLATLYGKLEDLQARVKQLEGGEKEDDEFLSAEPARARFTGPRTPRHRADDRER